MRRLLLLVLLAACDLPSGELPPTLTPYRVRRSAPVPDTTLSLQFLVLASNGEPAVAPVDFTLNDFARISGMTLDASGDSLTDSIRVTSDASGIARVSLTFAKLAGRAVVYASAPTLGAFDSIVFDLSGAAAAIIDIPPVIPLYTDDTLELAGSWTVYDSGYRPTFAPEPVFAVDDTTIASFATPARLVTRATGATWLHARSGAGHDSVYLAVVPPGSLRARVSGTWSELAMNGQNRVVLATAFAGLEPRSSPSGDTLAYLDGAHLQLRLPGGTVVQLVPGALGFDAERQPWWSADGQWVYFSGVYGDGRREIWRVHPDGTGGERAGPVAGAGTADQEPSTDAAGSRLALTTNRTLAGGQPTLLVVDATNGATVYAGPAAAAARFSPDGARIAFLSGGQLMVVGADGSNQRTLAGAGTGFSGALSWSPDSRWIVVARATTLGSYLHLVDTATDRVIRLPYSFQYDSPEWR